MPISTEMPRSSEESQSRLRVRMVVRHRYEPRILLVIGSECYSRVSSSVERGARVAETGTLVPRTRSGSTKEASTIGTVGEESLEQVDEKLGMLDGNKEGPS